MSLEHSVSDVTELVITNQSAVFIHCRRSHHFLNPPNLSTRWEQATYNV